MNPLFQRLMHQASRMTRGGDLQEATRAIQRALGSVAPPAAAAANDDALVVDVPSRVVETSPNDGEQWVDGVFAHRSRSVAYKLFVPAKGAGTPRPLLLMLHGCTQNPDDFAAGTQMNRLARDSGCIVLYPAQTQHANSSKCWNWFKSQHQGRERGEPALLAALTRSVMSTQSVDPARVYVAGLSAGGAMADILGRTHPDLFAAVGVHSGLASGAANDLMSALSAMKSGAAGATAPGSAVPTIVFHGDTDTTVNPRNGEQVTAAALAGHAGNPAATSESTGLSAAGRRFTRREYSDGQGKPAVEHWLLHGAGHAWAGGSAKGSYTDPAGPDASAEMLRFFLAHPKGATAGAPA
ncbi:MAG: PHB depolymerase family esterase [Variovorax sp.]